MFLKIFAVCRIAKSDTEVYRISMGRPKLANSVDTKVELLNAALILLQTKGYSLFTFQDLAERLKIKRESIHYHYPTKEDLGIKLAKHAMEGLQQWIDSLDVGLSPIERLDEYFKLFVVVSAWQGIRQTSPIL